MPKIIGSKVINAENFKKALSGKNLTLTGLQKQLKENENNISYFRLIQYARGYAVQGRPNKIFPKNLMALSAILSVSDDFLTE